MPVVYLIPALLSENALEAIPAYVLNAIKDCQVFFVENERTTRRYFKQLWPEMIIDNYEWVNMKDENQALSFFKKAIKENKNIGIVSEAGCPGIADPGQKIIALAQEMNIAVKPIVGPNSILLALMASGMSGQQFQFHGYLPIDNQQRIKTLKELETNASRNNCTQIFIETPYRNNQLIEAICKTCVPSTQLCIGVDITGKNELIKTKTVKEWQQLKPDFHKIPAIFLLYAGQ
ncbi:MAG TPA: SAM-dependent methyltransferase [Chitinophagaceae bacterium]|jgi:16S rRNA (cytidine1402-2'-O)-methyltransferase|nr:SAM-dependent methyltransferase [Chitinophagaceae bacterium]